DQAGRADVASDLEQIDVRHRSYLTVEVAIHDEVADVGAGADRLDDRSLIQIAAGVETLDGPGDAPVHRERPRARVVFLDPACGYLQSFDKASCADARNRVGDVQLRGSNGRGENGAEVPCDGGGA